MARPYATGQIHGAEELNWHPPRRAMHARLVFVPSRPEPHATESRRRIAPKDTDSLLVTTSIASSR